MSGFTRLVENFKGRTGGSTAVNVNPGNGTPVLYFEDKGVTMVPLRELAKALGFAVHWDDATRTICISNDGRDTVYGTAVKIEDMKVIRNVGPFYRNREGYYQIAGRRFHGGVAVDISKNNPAAEFVLDLNGNYLSLEGHYGVDDETMNSRGIFRMIILGDERVLYDSHTITPSTYAGFLQAGDFDLSFVNPDLQGGME